MDTKSSQKIQKMLKLLLILALFVPILSCDGDDLDKKTTVSKSDSEATLTEEKTPKETATPTPDNSAEQSEIEQNTGTSPANNVVTYNSFSKVKVGMTVSQASQALGTELVGEAEDGMNCYYVNPKQDFKGVRFMVTGKTIARIDIESKAYATDKGAKIGDTEDKIKSLYKEVEVFPNKYDEKKHDLEVYSADKKYLIIFETDGNRVTGFRVGKAEEVSYVEGCS